MPCDYLRPAGKLQNLIPLASLIQIGAGIFESHGGIDMKKMFNAFVVCVLALTGCSSTETITQSIQPKTANSYFPAFSGYEAEYEEITYSGARSTYKIVVGDSVSIDGQHGFVWEVIYSNGASEKSFVVATSSYVAHYENGNAPAEMILSLPLVQGKSWDRFDNISTGDLGFEDNNGDGLPDVLDTTSTGDTGGDGGDGGGLFQSSPLSGGNIMVVEAAESITLRSGQMIAGTVRVRNDAAGSSNYYWYAQGKGIVRYSLGAQPSDPSRGSVVGEKLK